MRVLAVLLVCWISAVQAEEITYRGSGTSSCGRWVEMREDGRAGPMEGWLMGYLSGKAEGQRVDVLRTTDNQAAYVWMDAYCQANPLRPMLDGAQALFLVLLKR